MRRIGRLARALAGCMFALLCYEYLTLPDVRVLRSSNPASTAFIDLRSQQAEAEGRAPRRVQSWVPYNRISNHLKRAVLVAEDSAFWEHDGIDLEQIRESMEVNIERRTFARGASTITQQLAKNLYLSPSKNPMRKFEELLIARRLEAELSKQRILELYLNVIEWGEGIYGAEAAARSYFGSTAATLGADQAALLAGAIINPRLLNPAHPTSRLRRRQQMLARRMGTVEPPPPEPEAGDHVVSSAEATQPGDHQSTPDEESQPGPEPAPIPEVPIEPAYPPDAPSSPPPTP